MLLSGDIEQLSLQVELMMEELVGQSSSVSSVGSVDHPSELSAPSVSVPPLSQAGAPATVTTTVSTASDVRRLPRLNGGPDVEVAAVLL